MKKFRKFSRNAENDAARLYLWSDRNILVRIGILQRRRVNLRQTAFRIIFAICICRFVFGVCTCSLVEERSNKRYLAPPQRKKGTRSHHPLVSLCKPRKKVFFLFAGNATNIADPAKCFEKVPREELEREVEKQAHLEKSLSRHRAERYRGAWRRKRRRRFFIVAKSEAESRACAWKP